MRQLALVALTACAAPNVGSSAPGVSAPAGFHYDPTANYKLIKQTEDYTYGRSQICPVSGVACR